MKKIILISIAAIFSSVLSSCIKLDLLPVDQLTSAAFEKDPSGIEYATIGAYQWFFAARSNPTMPGGSSSRTRYIRNWFQMSEFRGDNVFIAGATSDPFMKSYDYRDVSFDETVRYMWYCSYSILNIVNTNIGVGTEGQSLRDDHILGENYFLRAYVYLNLCDLFARPYAHGADNPAVILRTEKPYEGEVVRASIGEIYAQVESDLKKAIELMGQDYRRDNNGGYAWKGAAQGLLSRLYLYMGRDQDVVNTVNEMLAGASPADVLDPDLATYFTRTQTSRETLWCIALLPPETMGNSSVASMYFQAPNGAGWGQIYTSDPMYKLFTRYADDDIRWRSFHQFPSPAAPAPAFQGAPVKGMASWPIRIGNDPSYVTYGYEYRYLAEDEGGKYIIFMNKLDPADPNNPVVLEENFFHDTNAKIYIKEKIVNTYPEYYITYNGADIDVVVTPPADVRFSYRKIFNTKFSWQDGDPMLCSMPMIRWGEVILNRAEAYAKLNNPEAALADVNAIRTRAGLSGDQLMTTVNMGPRGYETILDVVLDERRLELCYEGFRYKDVFRNQRPLDRRFAGSHIWEVVNWDDPRIPHQISEDEMVLNPGVVRNPGKL